jgi:hypothetical protein
MDDKSETRLTAANLWAGRRSRALTLLRESGLTGLIRKGRQIGLKQSVEFTRHHIGLMIAFWMVRRFDRKFGVDTGGFIEVRNLTVRGPYKELANHAVSTSPRMFRFLTQFFPKARSDFTYIDLGSGKGRTLLLASTCGFRRVIGVEFAEELCAVARDNVTKFGRKRQTGRISVINEDATTYRLPDDNLVLYFGNPFTKELWPAMIDNVTRSYSENRRPICLLLVGSVYADVNDVAETISGSGCFRLRACGVSPFFVDTYAPFHYRVFEAC